MPEPADDPRLLHAVDLFNRQEFFACHDLLEEIWSERVDADRTFYQGLIHAAVALFHFEGGNLGGARKMYGSAVRYLSPFAPARHGLDVAALLADLQTCFQSLLDLRDPTDTSITLPLHLVPQIRRSPPRSS